jgi:uncharacterized protein
MASQKIKSIPIVGVFALLFVCLLFRLLDIFILRLDEKIGEIILSKTIGVVLIFLFIRMIGKSIKDIQLSRINLNLGARLAVFQAILALVLCFGVKYLFLASNDGEPQWAFSNEFTFIQIILFVFIGNLTNTVMEEGLFRGLMIHSLLKKVPFWLANTIQACLFGLWHIPWTIRDYTSGNVEFATMISNSILYTIISGIMGAVMGYLFYRTQNLWTPIIWHWIWNCTMNLLVIQVVDDSILSNADVYFWITFLIYAILSFLITYFYTKRNNSHIKRPTLEI